MPPTMKKTLDKPLTMRTEEIITNREASEIDLRLMRGPSMLGMPDLNLPPTDAQT